MLYFHVRNTPEKNAYYKEHFELNRELTPYEILSSTDVKNLLPVNRKNMSNYIAQIIGDSFKTTTANIVKKDNGLKFIKDYDKCIGNIKI